MENPTAQFLISVPNELGTRCSVAGLSLLECKSVPLSLKAIKSYKSVLGRTEVNVWFLNAHTFRWALLRCQKAFCTASVKKCSIYTSFSLKPLLPKLETGFGSLDFKVLKGKWLFLNISAHGICSSQLLSVNSEYCLSIWKTMVYNWKMLLLSLKFTYRFLSCCLC